MHHAHGRGVDEHQRQKQKPHKQRIIIHPVSLALAAENRQAKHHNHRNGNIHKGKAVCTAVFKLGILIAHQIPEKTENFRIINKYNRCENRHAGNRLFVDGNPRQKIERQKAYRRFMYGKSNGNNQQKTPKLAFLNQFCPEKYYKHRSKRLPQAR